MRKIVLITLVVAMLFAMTGCASWDRLVKDIKSNVAGGMNRTVTVYTADGNVIVVYKGKIDLESTEGGIVKFDLNGKRYMYYNCFVEAIEEAE